VKVAVIVVAFTHETLLIVTPLPLMLTVQSDVKFVPVSVTAKEVPWKPLGGVISVSVGDGGGGGGGGGGTIRAVTLNPTLFDDAPLGFVTVTPYAPTEFGKITVADSSVGDTNEVCTAEPLKLTVDPAKKFVPVTERVALVPAKPLFGETFEIVGVELRIVIVSADESCAGVLEVAGFSTTTSALPNAASIGMVAVMSVAEFTVADIGLPRKRTTVPGPKFVPLTSIVCPPITLCGVTPVMVGGKGVISIANAFDVPPPGVPVKTVTLTIPSGYGGISVTVN
jgi:hypothetical protein